MLTNSVLTISESKKSKVCKLSEVSHHKTMDHATVLPWDQDIDLGVYPKNPEHLWINGTRFCDGLSEAQKLELAWLETARDISMFIWLEQTIPPLYMGYVTQFHDRISQELQEYLMIFSKEEIIHTLTFKRFMGKANLQLWKPPVGLYELLTQTLPKMEPAVGVLFTLLIEWVAELGAMHTSQGKDIEPMTRTMFREHHRDEARHIAFGRWISESFFETTSPESIAQVRQMSQRIISALIDMFTYNPEIALHTSFEFPIAVDDKERIEQVWRSEHNKRLNDERFAELYAWVDKLGLRQ
ncbi:diiron oxygenase [Pseudomonas sp. TH31]|uniref:diiron oxygenase n=1 Tax=Pseudomonas sp. TH31 TaxID=2796396 RepID=UPI00191409C4|nr:diiron oxygenase [Pseudomonas sp. TH31]MBK5416193.1 diiron oxygenase [Pseudomonas sp. TH31]